MLRVGWVERALSASTHYGFYSFHGYFQACSLLCIIYLGVSCYYYASLHLSCLNPSVYRLPNLSVHGATAVSNAWTCICESAQLVGMCHAHAHPPCLEIFSPTAGNGADCSIHICKVTIGNSISTLRKNLHENIVLHKISNFRYNTSNNRREHAMQTFHAGWVNGIEEVAASRYYNLHTNPGHLEINIFSFSSRIHAMNEIEFKEYTMTLNNGHDLKHVYILCM